MGCVQSKSSFFHDQGSDEHEYAVSKLDDCKDDSVKDCLAKHSSCPEIVPASSFHHGFGSTPLRPANIIYVGIDVGAALSGYAFAYGSDAVPTLQREWPGLDTPASKTLTALLYDTQTWQPVAWGMQAYLKYLSLRPSTQDQFAYVEGCNLLVAHAAEAPADAAAGAEPLGASASGQAAGRLPSGCPHSPKAVLGHYLGFLQQHLQQQLVVSFTAEAVQRAELKYCIAIPAGLSDEAKKLVRQAAVLGGLVSERSAQQDGELALVYAPEAAALAACEVPHSRVEVGDRLLVLDAGAATSELVLHVVEKRGDAKVLSEAAARRCMKQGSNDLDAGFERWLANWLGQEAYDTWRDKCVLDHAHAMAEWRRVKRSYTGTKGLGSDFLHLPLSLVLPLACVMRMGMAEVQQLAVGDADMRAIFDDVTAPIAQAIQELAATSDVAPTRLVLAGGLGASPYLRRWLAAAFGSSLGQLTVLPAGEAAVVQGAVRLLQKPGSIAARVSNQTYCIQATVPWDERTMPESIREWRHNMWVTTKGLVVAVRRGESVETDHMFTHKLVPETPDSQHVSLAVYGSSKAAPHYLEEDMPLVARFDFPVDQSALLPGEQCYVTVALRFGGAEVVVEVLQEPPARVPRVSLLRPLESPPDSCSSRSASSNGSSGSGSSEEGSAYTARSHGSEELQGCCSADHSVLSSAGGSVAAEEAEAGEEVASAEAAGAAGSIAPEGGAAADVAPSQVTVAKGTGAAAVVAGEAAGACSDAAQHRDQAAVGAAVSGEPAGSNGLASGSQGAAEGDMAESRSGAAQLAVGEPAQAAAEAGAQEAAAPACGAAAAAEECAEERAGQCTEHSAKGTA